MLRLISHIKRLRCILTAVMHFTRDEYVRQLTKPDGMVLWFAVLESRFNLDVFIGHFRIFERKNLQLPLHWVHQLPGREDDRIDEYHGTHHAIQLPTLHLLEGQALCSQSKMLSFLQSILMREVSFSKRRKEWGKRRNKKGNLDTALAG